MSEEIKDILNKFDKVLENYELDKKFKQFSVDSICHLFPNEMLTIKSTIDNQKEEIDRLNNIISQIETLVINHNCDTGDIYYKYNDKYLKSELKERIIELVELKENK